MAPKPPHRDARARRLGAVFAIAAVAASAALRIVLGLSDPGFDRSNPDRLLKSDPALLYYVVERLVESGGLPPDDFRADPRVEHPGTTDLPALLPIQQEFAAAWLYLALGGDLPLHVFCLLAMGVAASLACLGVYGLARELTGSTVWAALALALYVLSAAAYRTSGFILMSEDWSLPWFSLHLWLLARAARRRTPGAIALAAVALGLALASWHAMLFVATLEMACVFAWFLRTGENPVASRHGWVSIAVLALFAAGVPVLRATGFWLSLPMQWLAALALSALAARRLGHASLGARAVALGAWAGLLLAAWLAGRAGLGSLAEYSHVFELMWAKLRWLGRLPEDPALLSFDARLLWQGPFETASIRELFSGFLVGMVFTCVAACAALSGWWRGRGEGAWHVLVAFAASTCLVAWLVRRNLVLPALVTPAIAVALLARAPLQPRAPWIAGLAAAQALLFAGVMSGRQSLWYFPVQQDELANVVHFVRHQLPSEGAIASDFVNSPALLAGTRHPIVLQPKYESAATRRRIERLLTTVFHGSLDDLRALLAEWRCRYLLVDRQTLWQMRYVAGLRLDTSHPLPGTAAESLLSDDPAVFAALPGLALVYRSRLPSEMMRLYEIQPGSAESGLGRR